MRGCGEAFRAHLVNDADDFVILGRGHAHEALQWTTAVMTRIGLRINEAKTSVKDVRTESFDFLGYTFGPKYGCRDGGRSIWARVHPELACSGSRPGSATCWCRATRVHGHKYSAN
jgi:RNA-directed DNA polymerase